MKRALVLLCAVLDCAVALDLTRATVVAPQSLGPIERKAVTMLVEEAEKRSQVRWPVSASAGAGATISVRSMASGAKEGYTLRIDGGGVQIEGNDARGVLFG